MIKKIGYSFYGFLGSGVADCPDGGRTHRKTLIDELLIRGHQIIFLQEDRDRIETGKYVYPNESNVMWNRGYPQLDILFLEWRWLIPGRNTENDKGKEDYTPDWTRQEALLHHYSKTKTKIVIWDKDCKMSPKEMSDYDESDVVLLRPGLLADDPWLYFPFPVSALERFSAIENLKQRIYDGDYFKLKDIDLIYIGNQYGRDEEFERYYGALSRKDLSVRVYGNWIKYPDKAEENRKRWPLVDFRERITPAEFKDIYPTAWLTILINPLLYMSEGQITQRIFEAPFNLCLPMAPHYQSGIKTYLPNDLIFSCQWDIVSLLEESENNPSRYCDLMESLILNYLSRFDVKVTVENVAHKIGW